jgi:hypothetical protein
MTIPVAPRQHTTPVVWIATVSLETIFAGVKTNVPALNLHLEFRSNEASIGGRWWTITWREVFAKL